MIKQAQETVLHEGLYGGEGKVWVTRNVTVGDQLSGLKMFAKVAVDSGASIGYHDHPNDAEGYYIVSGKGVFLDHGHVERNVQAGDFCFITKGQGHGIQNTGGTILELIAVVIP